MVVGDWGPLGTAALLQLQQAPWSKFQKANKRDLKR